MTEIKSYGRPPPLVEKVMAAVMTLQCKEPTWAEAKRQLGEAPRPAAERKALKSDWLRYKSSQICWSQRVKLLS